MSTELYDSKTGVFNVTRVAGVCNDCGNEHFNGMPAPVYQLTGKNGGYVTLCFHCQLRALFVSAELG